MVWIGVAIAYRAGRTGNDLSGWACSPSADKIQANFEGIVDFDKICTTGVCTFLGSDYECFADDEKNPQERQFGLTIASAVVNIFSAYILFLVWGRREGKEGVEESAYAVGIFLRK